MLKPETIAFFRGSWSGKGKKVIKNFGGNFWGPTSRRCSIIQPAEMEWMLEEGIALRAPGNPRGVLFPPVEGESA